MSIIDRILLAIYSLSLTLAALICIVLTVHVVPDDLLINNFLYLIGRWETGTVAGVYFLVGLRLLKVSLSVRRVKKCDEAIVLFGEIGQVRVTVEAIKNLVEKTVQAIKGVRSTKIEVLVIPIKGNCTDHDVKVKVKIVVGPEVHVPEVSDQIQQMVKETLKNTVGIVADEIEVLVENISNAYNQKQRVM